MAESIWQRQMQWAFYVAQDYRLADAQFRSEALDAGRKIMQRARQNIETIVTRLQSRGYEFVEPECTHRLPTSDVADWAAEFEAQGICLPISFQAWLQEVGTVNLMGTDRSWSSSGYYSMGQGEVWHTDPLVVDVDKDYIYDEFSEWKWRCDEEGFDEVGPFCIPFAPDDLHKANISGGAPYELCVTRPAIDSLVLNERHCSSFIAHIRNAFVWGGFPGFEIIDNAPSSFLAEMRSGLKQI